LRILLDENLDWRLERDLAGHDVASVPRIGWAGITNGELMSRAQDHFDILITIVTGLVHQRNIAEQRIAVLVLKARSNRLADTRPLIPKVLSILETLDPGTITII